MNIKEMFVQFSASSKFVNILLVVLFLLDLYYKIAMSGIIGSTTFTSQQWRLVTVIRGGVATPPNKDFL